MEKPDKAMSLLGFAARARKIQTGYNTAKTTMEKGRARLLIIASDLSENTKEKMISYANQYEVPYEVYGLADELSHITGNEGKGIFIISDRQFAESIAKAICDTKNVKEVF